MVDTIFSRRWKRDSTSASRSFSLLNPELLVVFEGLAPDIAGLGSGRLDVVEFSVLL